MDFVGTNVRMPTGATLIGVRPETYIDSNGQSDSAGYVLTFDLGNGMVLELHHVKPSAEILALGNEIRLGNRYRGVRHDRWFDRGAALGEVDTNAYHGRNDHVHLQITVLGETDPYAPKNTSVHGGIVNGTPIDLAVDPVEMFDPRELEPRDNSWERLWNDFVDSIRI